MSNKLVLTIPVAFLVLVAACLSAFGADRFASNNETSFDSDWRFLRADADGVEAPGFDDSAWRRARFAARLEH